MQGYDAPPQLTADAPVLDITHPCHVHVGVLLWHELNVAILHRFNRWFGKGFNRHIPLVGQKWFNDCTGAVATGGF